MSTHRADPWMEDEGLTAGERADLLLAKLSLDEKMAQVSCYFPSDIAETADVAKRFPYGIGVVSTFEARSAPTLDDVTAFQRRVQSAAMDGSGHEIPAIFHMEGVSGA